MKSVVYIRKMHFFVLYKFYMGHCSQKQRLVTKIDIFRTFLPTFMVSMPLRAIAWFRIHFCENSCG